jgi:hypothetical protein
MKSICRQWSENGASYDEDRPYTPQRTERHFFVNFSVSLLDQPFPLDECSGSISTNIITRSLPGKGGREEGLDKEYEK